MYFMLYLLASKFNLPPQHRCKIDHIIVIPHSQLLIRHLLHVFQQSETTRLSPATETVEPLCFTVVERNFWQLNKIPFFPTLFCRKKAVPPGIFTFTRIAVINRTGQRNSKPMKLATISKPSFECLYC